MGGMGNLGNLMQQAQRMQRDLAQVEEGLKERMVEGSAGDEAVTVIASGDLAIQSIRIDSDVVDADDIETLEDLLIAAVNQALTKAKELKRVETERVTGGLNIPGLV